MVSQKKPVYKQPKINPESVSGQGEPTPQEQKAEEQKERNANWQVVGWLNWTKSRNAFHVSYQKELIGCLSVKSLKEMLEGTRDSVAICAVLGE